MTGEWRGAGEEGGDEPRRRGSLHAALAAPSLFLKKTPESCTFLGLHACLATGLGDEFSPLSF